MNWIPGTKGVSVFAYCIGSALIWVARMRKVTQRGDILEFTIDSRLDKNLSVRRSATRRIEYADVIPLSPKWSYPNSKTVRLVEYGEL